MAKLSDDMLVSTQRGPKCSVGITLRQIDAADASTLRGWLADELTMSSAIVRALKAAGYDLNEGAVQRHRRGICRCPG